MRYIHGDFIIWVLRSRSKNPVITIHRDDKVILTYSDKFGLDIISGSCEEIVEAKKIVPEYYPQKVINLF